MPPPSLTRALYQLLEEQRRASAANKQQAERDFELQKKKFDQDRELLRQQQQYQRTSLAFRQRALSRAVQPFGNSLHGYKAADVKANLQQTGVWNKLKDGEKRLVDSQVSQSKSAADLANALKQYQAKQKQHLDKNHRADVDAARHADLQRRKQIHESYTQTESGLRSKYGDMRVDLHEQHQQAQQRKQAQQRQQQQKHAQRGHLKQLGLSALSGNVGGMAKSGLASAIGGTMGGAIAAGAAIAYNGLVVGAEKFAAALEILNNSFMTSAQKSDALTKEFIPGAAAFIALRRAVHGVTEALRQQEWAQRQAIQAMEGQGKIQMMQIGAAQEMDTHRARAAAFGSAAASLALKGMPGSIMPRRTYEQEIAYQEQQHLLPGKYAAVHARAEAEATERALNASQKRLRDLKAEQPKLLNEVGTYTDPLLGQRKTWVPNWGGVLPPDLVTEGRGWGAMGRLHDARNSGLGRDEEQLAINKAANEAARAALSLAQNKVQQEKELVRIQQLSKDLAQKHAAERRAALEQEKGQLAFMQQQEGRLASGATAIGGMKRFERQQLVMAAKWFDNSKDPSLMPSHFLGLLQRANPEKVRKRFEQIGADSPELKELQRKGWLPKGDLEQMRHDIQVKAAEVQVKVLLNEAQTAAEIVKMLDPVLKELIRQLKIEIDNEREKLTIGMIQGHNRQP